MKPFPPWGWMCVLAGALWAAAKAGTLVQARGVQPRAGSARVLAYLVLWPGMNAGAFLSPRATVPVPPARSWLAAFARIAAGAALVFLAVPRWIDRAPLAAGWMGMVGLVLLLHFGIFDAMSLAWRASGVAAWPLMDAPGRSVSLDELWSRRWNRGYHELVARWLFAPARRWIGPKAALATSFVASGLVHEMVITVPAGGGYGGPTAYFAMQAAGIALQRTPAMRRAGWARGARGWILTAAVSLGPVAWLFPPPFVRNVIVPFLRFLHPQIP